MNKRCFFAFAVCFFSFIGLGQYDYVSPLGVNPSLLKPEEFKLKNSNQSIDSSFFYITDTLGLPFFDEFSKNNFQEYSKDFNDPNIDTETYFRLLDIGTNVPLPPNTMLTDSATFKLVIDLIQDTIYSEEFTPIQVNYHPLTSYPVNHVVTNAFPPYIIIDTIDVTPRPQDTIWLNTNLLIQDSATVFIQELNDPGKLWLNKQAYHNYRYAVKPWSLGVVTFDGLDENGYPYFFGQTNNSAFCDTLLSKPIDLSTYTPNDSIYFSFLFQTQGYGDIPEENDSLFLQFYDIQNDTWEFVWSTGGAPLSDFKVAHFKVTDLKYYQKGFQFRFINYGSPTGALDHFHIDYVNLRPFSGYQDTLFKDFAFVYPISTLLDDYISVPWKHYKNSTDNLMSSEVKITVRNGSELTENNQQGNVQIFEGNNNVGAFTLNATLLSGGNINYAPRTTYTSFHDFSTGYEFNKNFPNDTLARFDWVANASAQFPSFPQNDSTFGQQSFENYYAYDDGTAEEAYGVFGTQAQLAYQFEMLEADSLIGVKIHFVPTVTDVSNNLFLLAVWNDNNGVPGTKIYEDEFFFPKQPIYTHDRNVFHTYLFKDTMKVPVGNKFYVGWRQIDEERLNLGFDKNHNHQDKIFWSVDGGNIWNNANFQGALMMRPVITSIMDYTLGVQTNEIHEKTFKLYPNPTSNSFKIETNFEEIVEVNVKDIQGRTIKTGLSYETFDLSGFQKGIYFVSLQKKGIHIQTKKLVLN